MSRSLFLRGLAMMACTVLFVVGCSETPTEGNLPVTKAGTPEDMERIQKELIQAKIPKEAAYKAPPGVTKPSK